MKYRFANLVMSKQEFSRIGQLIYQRVGLVLGENKKEMVYNRLVKRLQQVNMNDFSQYLAYLEADPQSPEWQEFVNALTTNLTSFFRERHHFTELTKHAKGRRETYKVWCNAASTGEEPYSIAITLAESLGCLAHAFQVYATDIDTQVLDVARRGVYAIDKVKENLTAAQLQTYFFRGVNENAGFAKVKKELMSCVEFQQLNLFDPSWAQLPAPFDAIFCRNVMIYFNKETQLQLLKRFVPLLKPDGLLFVGHSENIHQISSEFKLQGNTVYVLSGRK